MASQEDEAVFALHDSQTEEIGTWSSAFTLPDLKKGKEASLFNLITGVLTEKPGAGKNAFSMAKEDGALEYGQVKFYPTVTNCFGFNEEPHVFFQVYLPTAPSPPSTQISLFKSGKMVQPVEVEIVAESWDKKARVWSALVNLNFQSLMPGEYT